MVLALLLDFSWISLLIFLGYQLRRHVGLFQRLYLPTPLIGGILGILLGPNVLGQFSPVCIQFSEYLASASLPVLACVFCGQLFLIKMDKKAIKKSILTYILLAVIILYQVVVGILLVRMLMPGQNDGYGLMAFASFLGGPGVAALPAGVIGEQANFSVDTANAIGATFATISVCTGCIFGMAAINIARHKGALVAASDIKQATVAELTGYVQPNERNLICEDVTNGNSVNSMTLQWSICGLLLLVGYGIMKLLQMIPALKSMTITICVLAGIPLSFVFKKLKLVDMVDKKAMGSFSSIALEYLVTFTIATTNIKVFATHGSFILVTTLVMLALNLICIFGLGKLWFKDSWFENSVCCYGIGNGVMATGLLLLQTSDPNNKTGVITNFSAAASLMMISTQMFYCFIAPMWCTNYGTMLLLGSAAALVIALVLGFIIAGKRRS